MALVYPGRLTLQERSNLETSFKTALKFKFFRFNIKSVNTFKALFTVPRDHLIYGIAPLIIEEPFNGSEVFLNIGTTTNPISVTHIRINNVTNIIVLPMYQDLQNDFGKIMSIPAQFFMGIKGEVEKPNKGSGYGIITLLDLGKVDGYG